MREVAGKARGWKQVRWREGTKGWLESRFYACRVQPAHGFDEGEPPHPEVWLLVEWPPGEKEPTKYFLCDLPENYTLRRLVRIVKGRWKIEQDYQQLKEELGLDHYEGRNWTGLAPSCHPGHVGACFPDLGDVAQQKKLLGGPCHRRAVRSNACCLPGPASARIVAA